MTEHIPPGEPEYIPPGEPTRIDYVAALLASCAERIERMGTPMADNFLDQLKAEVEAAEAAKLAAAQQEAAERGKAFLDSATAAVEANGGKQG